MKILMNTDSNIAGRDQLAARVTATVEAALSRFSHQITRVEVHLSDVNSGTKGGDDDLRCLMEARLEGRQPIAVSHQAATVDQAIDGAAEKLKSFIESTIGRLRDQRRRDDESLGGTDRRAT